MFRLNKLTDYGILLMTCIAENSDESIHSARGLAAQTHLPLTTVVKILRPLLEQGLVFSRRGTRGGYRLARNPQRISIAEIIAALEGPIGFTECNSAPGDCEVEKWCGLRNNSLIIAQALQRALRDITLADLAKPLRVARPRPSHPQFVTSITLTAGRA